MRMCMYIYICVYTYIHTDGCAVELGLVNRTFNDMLMSWEVYLGSLFGYHFASVYVCVYTYIHII